MILQTSSKDALKKRGKVLSSLFIVLSGWPVGLDQFLEERKIRLFL
tara:strand:- start:65 stop:202 length:138 start_codon:yes stop_codon:yes gene_type:complete